MPTLEKFNKSTIDELPLPDKPYERYWHPKMTDFGVKVTNSGKKTYILRYRSRVTGKRRTMKIGNVSDIPPKKAEEIAIKIRGEVSEGKDPLAEQQGRRAESTFGEWKKLYLAEAKMVKKSWKDDDYYLRLANDLWGRKKLGAITKQMVRKAQIDLAKIGEDGKAIHPARANRFLSSVSACFSAAVREDILDRNPAKGIRKLQEPPPRSRVLSDEEQERLEEALLMEPLDNQIAFRILRETGARAGEVVGAKWEDIDFENRLWHLPDTKAGKPQFIPLNDGLASYLKMIHSTRLPSPDPEDSIVRGRWKGSRHDLKTVWRRLKKRANLDGIRMHDIRRTVGLKITMEHGLHVAKELLRHSDIRITQEAYAPLTLDTLRGAAESLSTGTSDEK